MLITAIDRGQDMSASDGHIGVASYKSCLSVPLAWSKRVFTRAAAKHVAIERMTIGTSRQTAI